MNITDFTARKLASADRSAADRKTGITRRKQRELAQVLDRTERGVQFSRDRLVRFGYLDPIPTRPGGYVSSYNVLTVKMANLCSASGKGEPTFASANRKANGGGQKGERLFQEGEPPFVHDPLISLDIPSAREPRRAEEALGPLGAALRQRIGPAAFEVWFAKGEAEVTAQTEQVISLAVRSKFFANQIRNRFEPDILACLPGVVWVEIVVKGLANGAMK